MQNEIDFLKFKDMQSQIPDSFVNKDGWLFVHRLYGEEKEKGKICCALIPKTLVPSILKDAHWEWGCDYGRPGIIEHGHQWKYYRYGNEEGIEPLVISRERSKPLDCFPEISEEFRLYFDRYYDKQKNEFSKVLDDGNLQAVIRVDARFVQIRIDYLKRFLALKNMRLAVHFCIQRFSSQTLASVGLKAERQDFCKGYFSYYIDIVDRPAERNMSFFTELCGKVLIEGDRSYDPRTEYRGTGQYEDFIIGVDSNGKDVTQSCGPAPNACTRSPDASIPHALSRVFFRKEVLRKYYDDSNFEVGDRLLRRRDFWSLDIDNNHPNYVIAILYLLGRDLPHTEQIYWKSFNVSPDGDASNVALRQWFNGECCDPVMNDLLFKQKLSDFQDSWLKRFGWHLFLPLSEGDQHYLSSLRIPLSEDQAEFDNQIQALQKILVESLNEEELVKDIVVEPTEKGITKFEKYLSNRQMSDFRTPTQFLRHLQQLRSAGSGHRKGSKYKKAAALFNLSEQGFVRTFDNILRQAIEMLYALRVHFLA